MGAQRAGGHLISRLRAPAFSAPNQPFRLLRCSAWLILHKRSTGALIPKRACSRASLLRLPSRASSAGEGESRVCARRSRPALLCSLFRLLFFPFFSFPFFWCINPGRKAIPPGGKGILPGRKGIPPGGKGDLRGISGRNPASSAAAALVQRKRKSRVCARRKPHRSLLSSAFLSISFSFFSFVAFVPDESHYVPDESRFVPDESRQSSLTPLRRKKMSTDAMSIRIHTMITSSCLLPAPSRCSSSVMVTNWRPKVTPSSAPRLHIVE